MEQLEWRKYLKVIAHPASPTDEQVADLIAGWEKYFARYDITDPIKQGKELRKVLRIRIAMTGNISILAPED